MAKPLRERKTVLLVQPAIRKVMKPRIPINLLPLGYTLRKAGFKPQIIDVRLKDFDEFEIDWSDVLMLGISTYTGPMIHSTLEISKKVRKRDKKIVITLGGVHPTLDAEQTAKHKLVDFVVKKDGEETIVELAKAIQKGKPVDKIKGIAFEKKGKVVSTPDRKRFDLNKIKILPYEMIDMDKYNMAEFPINTSRGCPFNCIFCYNQAFNSWTYSLKSAENVVDEIEYIVRNFRKVNTIAFSDDNFFMDKKRVEKICRELIRRRIGIKWMSTIRADYLVNYSDKFLKLMKDSGCYTVAFGAESGNDRILKIIGKGTTVEMNLGAVKKLKSSGIIGRISFVWGIPSETYHESIDSLNMIKKFREINPESIINGFFIATVYPNTRLFEKVREIVPDFKMPKTLGEWANWELYTEGFQPWLDPKYVDQMMTASEIIRFQFFQRMNPANYFKNPLVVLGIKVAEAVMNVFATLRLRYHFYKYGYEWKLFNKLRFKFIGIT